ncbi:MAG: hypothetical protein ACOC3H_01855 [bacterium]
MLTTRRFLAIAALTIAAPFVALAQHVPGDGAPELPDPGFELSGHTRLFYDLGDTDAMFEYAARYDTDRSALAHGLTAGAYHRIHRNVKIGGFYRLRIGERHDEDWVLADGEWIWRDTSGRPEHTFLADVTPRFLAEFLPGEDWVGAVKARYGLTLFREDDELVAMSTLLVRPGLTWFWMRDREPVMNASIQYGLYLPLGFGDTWWYRHGPYANLVYHLTPDLMLNASAGIAWIHWTESADFDEEWPNNRYAEPVYRPWTIDVGVIYRLHG